MRKALEYATQIATGLAAAHEKGVTHRDLKPDNVFVTADGRVKVLDFGLAWQGPAEAADLSQSPTESRHTDPGTVLGTVPYMSPEQVRGQRTDARSDIFSFGAVLYEMLSGRRAFARETSADTMTAILKEEPPDLPSVVPTVPASVVRLVQHCLEKNPAERFQSARDLAFDLSALSGSDASGASAAALVSRGRATTRRSLGLAALLLALGVAIGYWVRAEAPTSPPSFRPLTFRRGHVMSARFMPDGQTIVYGAMWEGQPVQMFSVRLGGSESMPLALPPGDVLSVSPSGELLISLGRRFTNVLMTSGRLARSPPTGGAPRELLEDVHEAAWARDGQRHLVVRSVGGKCRLEFPLGNVLYETPGWVSHARLSPKEDLIAFLDHPIRGDDAGPLAVIPTLGKSEKKVVTPVWASAQGVAWDETGREIWFTGAEKGWDSALYAATPAGGMRLVLRIPGRLVLHDRDSQGHLLLTADRVRSGTFFGSLEGDDERDLSWFTQSWELSLSSDGRQALTLETGDPDAGARTLAIYLRGTDGSPAVRLGDGIGGELSPDGRSVLVVTSYDSPRLALLPTGAGEARTLPDAGLSYQLAQGWLPDGRRIVFTATEKGRGARVYVQDLSGGAPKPITPEGFVGGLASPDGQWIVAFGPEDKKYLCPVEGEPTPLLGLEIDDNPFGFSSNARSLYVARKDGSMRTIILRYDLATGATAIVKRLQPRDPAGVLLGGPSAITPDGRHYLAGYLWHLSDLLLVEGVR